MNIDTKQSLMKFEQAAQQYLDQLDNLTMEQLIHKPNEADWSLGQMYQHLIQSALYMQLRNIEACRVQHKDASNLDMDSKTAQGEAVFAQGSFPPIRITVPASPEYTPKQPVSKGELTEGLQLVINRMKETEPTLQEIPDDNRTAHPGLGALNAVEWFALVEMHYRHHLLQNERLLALI
jgi:DinB superfamily